MTYIHAYIHTYIVGTGLDKPQPENDADSEDLLIQPRYIVEEMIKWESYNEQLRFHLVIS